MKKILNYFINILLIIGFTLSTAIFAYKMAVNISLIISSKEIVARIQNVEFRNSRRSHHCTIYFEYKDGDSLYTNHVSFNWQITDRINNFINNDYRKDAEILISVDKYDNFQVKKQVKKELFLNSLYFTISVLILITFVKLFISTLTLYINKKEHFYIQNLNYKIKNVEDIYNINTYITKIKNKEIICFGIGNKSNFVEYSYTGREFLERRSNNSKETERMIADDFELEKIVKLKLNKINKA